MITTWVVWSSTPPANLERVSCSSMFDAARGWAERQFNKGFVPRSGTEVLVRCENDPTMSPSSTKIPGRSGRAAPTTYQVKITIVDAPAFRVSLVGVAFEGINGAPRGEERG